MSVLIKAWAVGISVQELFKGPGVSRDLLWLLMRKVGWGRDRDDIN